MAVETALEVLPLVEGKPLDQLSTAELLQNAAHLGMRRMVEVLQWPLDQSDVAKSRLIIDTANMTTKLLARVEEAGLRASVNTDAVRELGDRLRKLEKTLAKPQARKDLGLK